MAISCREDSSAAGEEMEISVSGIEPGFATSA
jgi:hypothetical protein